MAIRKRRPDEDIVEAAAAPQKAPTSTRLSPQEVLSSGSTQLNLACTDTPYGAFAKGLYYFFVGDSSSGKTWFCMTCFAEAVRNKGFDDYRFIYDGVEDGALMSIERYFGAQVAERLEEPNKNGASTTIEDFYFNLDDALDDGRPFIYVLDSMDALTSESEKEKLQQNKTEHREGKELTGSYGDGKAKKNSAGIRQALSRIKKTGSILLVINQTRDNLGMGRKKKTRSGGNALRFYAAVEIWSSVRQKLTKTYKGEKIKVGMLAALQVEKNRFTGKERRVEVPFYYSVGIDDIGGCIDWLIEAKHWTLSKKSIKATGLFDTPMSRDKLIATIEEKGMERKLQKLVGRVWKEREDAVSIKRKKRYV